jgi:hypothetical protein
MGTMHDTATTTIQPLVEYFNRLILFSEEEKDLVTASLTRIFPKSNVVWQHGECSHDFLTTQSIQLKHSI